MKKFFLWLGSILILITLSLVIIFNFVIDKGVIKDTLLKQAREFTQRDIAIDGDLEFVFYPRIGLQLTQLKVFNTEDYSEAAQFSIQQLVASVELTSLLSKEIVISEVVIDGVVINVETLPDGRNNVTELLETVAPKEKPLTTDDIKEIELTPEGEIEKSHYRFTIEGIQLTDSKLSFNDRQIGAHHSLNDINLTVGQFSFDQPVPITLAAGYRSHDLTLQLNTSLLLTVDEAFSEIKIDELDNTMALTGTVLPRPEMAVSLAGNVVYNAAYKTAAISALKLKVDELAVSGDMMLDLFAKPSVEYNLTTKMIDLNDWLPAENGKTGTQDKDGAKKTTKPAAKQPEVEPDLSVLKSFNHKGSLVIAQLIYDQYQLDNIKLNTSVDNGIFKLNKLTSDLYKGRLTAKAELDGNRVPARFKLNTTLAKVESEPLITIATGKKLLTGLVDLDMQINGAGLTPTRIKKNTKGRINTLLSDGAIMGINVAQKIRAIIAKVSGEYVKEEDTAEQTDFSSAVASFSLANGKLTSTEVKLFSPALKIDGEGEVNLLREDLDFTFSSYLTENIGGKHSSTMKTIRKLRFPIDVEGPWAEPDISFDSGSVAKQFLKTKEDKIKKSVGKKLEKYLGESAEEEKVKEELFKGLDKWLK